MINYWWVTRPKRKLNSIPEILAVFSTVSLDDKWQGSRELHRMFEDGLENAGIKRVGDRRDASGSGGRTYYAWLASLGLVFTQESTSKSYLTLAGEAIMNGKSPVEVLKNQILKYQFPSTFSISQQSSKTRVNERFKIRPFRFLLRLLFDERIQYLTNDEIGKIIIVYAENETEQCYEHIVERLLAYREKADDVLEEDFFEKYAPSSGKVNPDHPYSHLTDVANTIVNWLDYTQLVYRENGNVVKLLDEKREEVEYILKKRIEFIDRPKEQEYFQRKYGLDPWHQKDTRNLANTKEITTRMIDIQKIRQAFISYSMRKPVGVITAEVIDYVVFVTGTDCNLVENTLKELYPHGAIGGFMTEYYEMAFKGTKEARQFEVATTELFSDVFGFKAKHLGQTGSKSTPDVLLLSDDAGYQAIIDNKAYARYSVSGDHHNRMVQNYLKNISNYSEYKQPIGFFTYISGGFGNQIDRQIKSIAEESGIHGSGMSVSTMIRLVETRNKKVITHQRIRELFSLDRQILFSDIDQV